jgi:hypothetical protein
LQKIGVRCLCAQSVRLALNLVSLWLFYGFVLVLASCGRSKGGGGSSARCADGSKAIDPGRQGLDAFAEPLDGYRVVINPLAGALELGVAWFSPQGQTLSSALRWLPPATVEGFHWPWQAGARASFPVWISHGDDWHLGCTTAARELPAAAGGAWAESLSSAKVVGFGHDFSNPSQAGPWPAVTGLGNGSSWVFSPLALSPVTPSQPGLPLRLELSDSVNAGTDPQIVSRAKSCGPRCLEFNNYAHALDSPFVVSVAPDDLFLETQSTGVAEAPEVRMVAFAHGDLESQGLSPGGVRDTCQDSWRRSLTQGARVLGFLAKKWSAPERLRNGFDIYLVHSNGASTYQGLEHSDSTLISVAGDCQQSDYSSVVANVVAHELVHIWNVRHLFPAEHAELNFGEFQPERIRQLFLYEGWTEGYARVALAELAEMTPAVAVAQWNASLQALYRAFENAKSETLVLNAVDANNALGQYQTGAAHLLLMAMKLRTTFTEDQARSRFWGLLSSLRERADQGKQSSWSQPPWVRRVWDGLKGRIESSGPWSQGYTSRQVVEMLEAEVGPLAGSSGDSVGLTLTAVDDIIRSYSAATGVQLTSDSLGRPLIQAEGASAQQALAWPFSGGR